MLYEGADEISLNCGTKRPFLGDPVISTVSLRSREHLPWKVHIIANEVSLFKNWNYSVVEYIKHNSYRWYSMYPDSTKLAPNI